MDLLKIFFVMLFILFGHLGLNAQAQDSKTLDSLDDIGRSALENSTAYRRVLLDVLTARNQLEGIVRLDQSSLSLKGATGGSSWDSSASLNLPLIDQLSLNASLDNSSSGQLGLSFSPLAHSDNRDQLKITYDKAVLLAGETAVTTENQALSAAFAWMSASRLLDIQTQTVKVKETVYRDEKVRYDAGESTLDDVRDALSAWTEARAALSDRQTGLRSAESSLLKQLGSGLEGSSVSTITAEALLKELEDLKSGISAEQADSSKVYAVKSAYQDVNSAKKSLADTWIFDPELNLTGNINFPDLTQGSKDSSWQAGVELVLSLNDWQGKERELGNKDLELTTLEAGQAEMESRLTLQQVKIALDNTEQNRILAGLERDQNHDLYEEAGFLFQTGDYSRAELDDARLLYEQSEVNFFTAAAAEYMAWRDLLPYL